MKSPLKLKRIIPIIIALGLLSICGQAQTSGGGVYSEEDPGPAIQARAEGNAVFLTAARPDMKTSILEHPVPEVWLIWPSSDSKAPRGQGKRSELPAEMKAILAGFWKAAVAFQYYENIEPTHSIQQHIDRDMAYSALHSKATADLRLLRIKAPDGERLISKKEADSLMMFITLASIDLVKQAKESKGGPVASKFSRSFP